MENKDFGTIQINLEKLMPVYYALLTLIFYFNNLKICSNSSKSFAFLRIFFPKE